MAYDEVDIQEIYAHALCWMFVDRDECVRAPTYGIGSTGGRKLPYE
jgi:hypothetical protein